MPRMVAALIVVALPATATGAPRKKPPTTRSVLLGTKKPRRRSR
jgi:hypothetical protein